MDGKLLKKSKEMAPFPSPNKTAQGKKPPSSLIVDVGRTSDAPNGSPTFRRLVREHSWSSEVTRLPTRAPSPAPTPKPTPESILKASPTEPQIPSSTIVLPLNQPTQRPSTHPTSFPTNAPTSYPTSSPTGSPTDLPSTLPSSVPTIEPSGQPTHLPSSQPSIEPSAFPSSVPTFNPSSIPSNEPTIFPSISPSTLPSSLPSTSPTHPPSSFPSSTPSSSPTNRPSYHSFASPSLHLPMIPTAKPTGVPMLITVDTDVQLHLLGMTDLMSDEAVFIFEQACDFFLSNQFVASEPPIHGISCFVTDQQFLSDNSNSLESKTILIDMETTGKVLSSTVASPEPAIKFDYLVNGAFVIESAMFVEMLKKYGKYADVAEFEDLLRLEATDQIISKSTLLATADGAGDESETEGFALAIILGIAGVMLIIGMFVHLWRRRNAHKDMASVEASPNNSLEVEAVSTNQTRETDLLEIRSASRVISVVPHYG